MREKKLKKEFGKEYPFTAPEGYFKQFPERLRARMEKPVNKERPAPRPSFIQMIRPQLALAAAILGAALISYLAVRFFTGRTTEPDYKELVDAVEYYLDDYALNDLIEEMNGEIIEEEVNNPYETEIMDYLLKEDIPASTLLDE